MHNAYEDIIAAALPFEPVWWDENGVPRFRVFAPRDCADIYADEAALVEIRCQSCRTSFEVAFTFSSMQRLQRMIRSGAEAPTEHQWASWTLAQSIRDRSLAYGDPPNAGCCPAGPTMSSDTVRVLEFWKRELAREWVRDPDLEVVFDESDS